jgi:hypothetical protein
MHMSRERGPQIQVDRIIVLTAEVSGEITTLKSFREVSSQPVSDHRTTAVANHGSSELHIAVGQ